MNNKSKRYDDEFKKNIVVLAQNGRTYNQLSRDYGVSHSAIATWIKQFTEVKLADDTILTAKEVERLRKRNAELEEENLILKKASAIFMQHSKLG
jgi:transposase-like protein